MSRVSAKADYLLNHKGLRGILCRIVSPWEQGGYEDSKNVQH